MNTFVDLFKEYLLILKNHYLFFRLTETPTSWEKGTKGDVLLIPGYAGTWTDLRSIGNHLNERGYKIHVLDVLNWELNTVDNAINEIKKCILEKNLKKLIVIGHSKGGLIARLLGSDREVRDKISKIFTIATPYGGTVYGYLQVFSLKELLPTHWIFNRIPVRSELAEKIVNIYPALDNSVIPNSSLELKNVLNIRLDIIGHNRILESPRLFEEIEKHI